MKIYLYSFTKTVIFLIVLAIFISFYSPQAAAITWEKYSENPVIASGDTGTWNDLFVRTPSIIYENGIYKAWFDGYDGDTFRIGYSESFDGVNWTQSLNNPVLDGFISNEDYVEPHVIKDDSKYKIWFTSVNKSTNSSSFKYAESLNGIDWTIPIVILIRTQEWEDDFIAHPNVIKVNDTYELTYNGFSNGQWKIGKATSEDGKLWNKYNNNPVLTPESSESPTVGAPSIYYDAPYYYMYYHSNNPGSRINVANSLNLINWTRNESVLQLSSGGFDSVAMISPSILKVGNQYRMYYGGYDGSKWAIGLAIRQEDTNTVPLLKQTSEPWQGQEYDTASKWSPNNSTINRWGCALTSAAMVFQYHGYTKLPDGTSLDPGSLNNWLNSQKDGYVGKGLVNWHALTRLSKQSTDVNNISEFDALEFSRRSADDSLLETDLSNQNPIILGEPGHFVVATEKLQTTFAINDPYYDRSTLTEGYNNAYLSLNRFIPSNTDLSTILIVLPLSLNIEMKDIDGNSIGATYIQTAIAAADDTSIKSGDDVKIFTAEKPDSGEYTIEITTANPQIFNIHGFLYNQDGEVNEISVSGIAHNKPNVYSLTFDKEENIENELHKIVSYQTILDELEIAHNNNKISNGMYNAIKHLISNSKKSFDKHKIIPAKVHLYTALGLLHTPGNKLIDEDYSEILSDDLHSIISSL